MNVYNLIPKIETGIFTRRSVETNIPLKFSFRPREVVVSGQIFHSTLCRRFIVAKRTEEKRNKRLNTQADRSCAYTPAAHVVSAVAKVAFPQALHSCLLPLSLAASQWRNRWTGGLMYVRHTAMAVNPAGTSLGLYVMTQ